MTIIDDEFAKIDMAEAYDDSAASPQEPERRQPPQQSQQRGTPRTISDDDSATDSDLILDGSYVSTFNTQTEDRSNASYLAGFGDIPGLQSLRRRWGSKEVVLIAVMGYVRLPRQANRRISILPYDYVG